jgi:hypothetical protein
VTTGLENSHKAAARRTRLAALDPWRAAEAEAMTEDELAAEVRKRCRARNFWVYHTHDSRRSDKGFPDEVIVGSWVIYRELKTETKELSADQLKVIARLQAAGADVGVWRPADLMSGRIDRELDALRMTSRRREGAVDINPYAQED